MRMIFAALAFSLLAAPAQGQEISKDEEMLGIFLEMANELELPKEVILQEALTLLEEARANDLNGWPLPLPTPGENIDGADGFGAYPEPSGVAGMPESLGLGAFPEPSGLGMYPEPHGFGAFPEPHG